MKISVELLKEAELQLAFHLATGYKGFDYFPDYNCWRAELELGKIGLTAVSVINDVKGTFRNRAYYKDVSESSVLKELRSENIGLRWDHDSNYELYFQAFPEITATATDLATAFMRIMVKKKFGDMVPEDAVDAMNLFKTRTKEGSPL